MSDHELEKFLAQIEIRLDRFIQSDRERLSKLLLIVKTQNAALHEIANGKPRHSGEYADGILYRIKFILKERIF